MLFSIPRRSFPTRISMGRSLLLLSFVELAIKIEDRYECYTYSTDLFFFSSVFFCLDRALLWHRLMGKEVLSTTHGGSPYLRAYAHCSRNTVLSSSSHFIVSYYYSLISHDKYS